MGGVLADGIRIAMLNLLIVLVAAATGIVLAKLARVRLWRAAVTPLASIIGSGFLVLGPILVVFYGIHAPVVMAALCIAAYLFGDAVRFNIARLDQSGGRRSRTEDRLDLLADWALAFAYVISVAYYLNLLGAFAVSLTPLTDDIYPKLVTTAVFIIILVVGLTRGFGALERMEQVSVGLKLSVIAGLLFGLGWYVAGRAAEGALVISPPSLSGGAAVALAAGLLVTVQGFETSRYLADEYDAATRIRSMRLAQGISTAIYMVYIVLLCLVFPPEMMPAEETAIIGLMALVAPVLPLLLIAAAISAQFSAAVADTGGAGGLVSDMTHRHLSERTGYAVLAVVGVALTWASGVFEIITYASRAFAVYYALQCLVAARGARATGAGTARAAGYALLACGAGAIALFGAPVE
ncbi:MAG: hypothetical protein NXH82_13640 [Rhodobacteraceae bacterium]|nr:hypothetical protein [Paracoccaceae bacterium]